MKWIIAANSKKFDHFSAFKQYGYIDWKKSCKFKTGDIVYVYCTSPEKAIRFKAVVTLDNMSFSDISAMESFWKDKKEYQNAQSGKYFRLQLIAKITDNNLSLDKLKQHGLKGAPQGPQKINESIIEYIEFFFDNENITCVIDEESFPEGRNVMHQHMCHERNQNLIKEAKEKFKQEHNGQLFCEACGFNFSEKYGDLGRNFIEAHHIKKPISQMTDGEKSKVGDLVMLCSNCHRMVHRKRPWVTKDKLKEIVK